MPAPREMRVCRSISQPVFMMVQEDARPAGSWPNFSVSRSDLSRQPGHAPLILHCMAGFAHSRLILRSMFTWGHDLLFSRAIEWNRH